MQHRFGEFWVELPQLIKLLYDLCFVAKTKLIIQQLCPVFIQSVTDAATEGFADSDFPDHGRLFLICVASCFNSVINWFSMVISASEKSWYWLCFLVSWLILAAV